MPRARGVPNPGNNRTDLPGKVPVMTAPDQTYGQQTAQQQSQRILPVAAPPSAGPGPAPGAGQPAPSAQPPSGLPAASPGPLPGQLPWSSAGTPGRPLMDLQHSPQSAGPLARLAAQQQNEQGSLRMLLGHLATLPGASEVVKGLAQVAGATVQA